MTPIEKTLISLSALVTATREGLKTHPEKDMAEWLHEKLEYEAGALLTELYIGDYRGKQP